MDYPGKNTGVGLHALLQEIFLTQGLNSHLLHWQVDSLPVRHLGSPLWESELLLGQVRKWKPREVNWLDQSH